jgi:hypothetical protein
VVELLSLGFVDLGIWGFGPKTAKHRLGFSKNLAAQKYKVLERSAKPRKWAMSVCSPDFFPEKTWPTQTARTGTFNTEEQRARSEARARPYMEERRENRRCSAMSV